MSYYTSITALCWLALGVLCILVRENDRMKKEDKRLFYLTYLVTALAALAEWLGVRFNGNTALPVWLLRAVKCADYILTPVSGAALVAQLRSRSIWEKLIWACVSANTVFQLVASFTGWMLTVDARGRYAHGPLYNAYIGLYLLVIVLLLIGFYSYGRQFRRRNATSLYAAAFLVTAGITLQELLGGEIRTAYLALTFGMALMFIHATEYSQLVADDRLHEQMIQITTDALTGVSSRHAYARALHALDAAGALPEKLTVFSLDINGLKAANDALGHEAGDELICAAARCIEAALGQWGECYRTGGDEFVVLAEMAREEFPEAMARLSKETAKWHGERVDALHLSVGSAASADHPGLSAEALVGIADQEMYADKDAWYRTTGRQRRR